MNKNFVFRGKINTSDYIQSTTGNKFLGGGVGNTLARLTTQQGNTINGVNFNNDYTAIFADDYGGDTVFMKDPTVTKSFSKIIVNKTNTDIIINFSGTSQNTISFTDNEYNSVLSPTGPGDVTDIILLPDHAIELSWAGTSWVLK